MNEDCLQSAEPYQGGSVMAWAGINSNGRTDLVVIPGRLTGHRYVAEVLRPHVIPMRAAIGDEFLLMQDNATPHTARVTTTFLEEQGIDTLDWPARSADLNPIENLWDQVKRKADKHIKEDTTLAQLGGIIQRAWNSIPQQNITTLVNSMRKRCNEVIDMDGGHIDY